MEWRFWARTRPAQLNAFGDVSGDDCEAIEPLLPLYGDGMASAAEARLVESHLPGCESCRESLVWMQATRRALSRRPILSPPADLHARIAEAIAASEAAPLRLRPARTFTTRPAFAAAASLAAVGLFLGYSLTHPGVAVKPVPPVSVAMVPNSAPPVFVAPVKPTAPTITVKKHQPTPLIANRDIASDDTPPALVTAPAPRVSEKNTMRSTLTAPAATAAITAPRPRLKPVTPPTANRVAVKSEPIVKHTPAPLPTKAPVLTATKEPDVQVLPAKVTPQEPPATEKVASATPSEPHTQVADFLREVHLPSTQAHSTYTVGTSLRGAVRATQAFGQDGKAAHIDCIHGNDF